MFYELRKWVMGGWLCIFVSLIGLALAAYIHWDSVPMLLILLLATFAWVLSANSWFDAVDHFEETLRTQKGRDHFAECAEETVVSVVVSINFIAVGIFFDHEVFGLPSSSTGTAVACALALGSGLFYYVATQCWKKVLLNTRPS